MVLYHFCAKRHMKSILKAGLTLGCVTYPTDTGFRLKTGFQWLTTNKEPAEQSWATKEVISYNRTEYRLTVRIPDEEVGKRLITGDDLIQEFPATVYLFRSWKGSKDWRIYVGTIPREWIIAVDKMI